MGRGLVGRLLTIVALLMLSVGTGTLGGPGRAEAATTTGTATVAVNHQASGFTDPSPKTIFSTAPSFERFDPSLGTLDATTLSWDLTATVNGVGNFGADGTLSYAGRQASAHFDTGIGPATFDFSGTETVTGETGSGSYSPSSLVGTVSNHSGYYPWGAVFVVSGTITLTYDYTPAPDPAPVWEVPDATTAGTDEGRATAVVTYTATVTDNGTIVSQSCSPPSGSEFVLGTTTVTCQATDDAGNSSTAEFQVTVVDDDPPVVTAPGDIVESATSAAGAPVSFPPATATDNVTSTLTVICDRASGATFPIGSTTVTCSATDEAGNTGTDSFQVTVADTTGPSLALADLQVAATGPDGATVEFEAVATDVVDGELVASCQPASGTRFPLGETTVTCTAADRSGNETTATFTVTVVDEGVPLLSLPADRTVEATGPDGAVVEFSVTASDAVDGDLEVSCTPRSGSTFPIGTTDVECHATDSAGSVASGGFTVTVVDTTGPQIDVPTAVTAIATGPDGALVEFDVTARDAVVGDVPVTCVPASGSLFAVGATTVTCTASDAPSRPLGFRSAPGAPAPAGSGNVSTASFVVTVTATATTTATTAPQLLPATE